MSRRAIDRANIVVSQLPDVVTPVKFAVMFQGAPVNKSSCSCVCIYYKVFRVLKFLVYNAAQCGTEKLPCKLSMECVQYAIIYTAIQAPRGTDIAPNYS
jgi:hypothetical protein